ncbi:GAF domain-containing sensor histidine kinase [Stackebrandtia albiflava]|uniref:GAF domain-containing sensor histidine kinase n=1 Tax=Stackebrandtia albiflava TaxID=406432 RepID=UPI001B869C78|nr:GAF domain-containing protein [Stackebrandtia albiflava]
MTESDAPPGDSAAARRSGLSTVQLDVLLSELLTRVGDVTSGRERLRGLLHAVVSIGSDLRLPGVLDRIVAAARTLGHARYAALGVTGPHKTIVGFHTDGLTPEEAARMTGQPTGDGLLGEVIRHERIVRLADVTRAPGFTGYPAGHPVMRGLLAVPIRIREQVFGALYLADKHGGAAFNEDDEEVIAALSAAAAVAIENAQLYQLSNRRQRWFQAAAEITNLLLGTVDPEAALHLVASRARETGNAYLAMVVLRDHATADRLTVEVAGTAEGTFELAGAGLRLTGDALGQVVTGRRSAIVHDLGTATDWPIRLRTGPAVIAPLATTETCHGALIVASAPASPAGYSSEDIALLESFAGQAALALERARAQQDRADLAVFEDRERIARDLHDLVIQRLFATGLRLQSAIHLTARPEVVERLNLAVDELDATIRDLRASIFQLHRFDEDGLHHAVREVVDGAAPGLGFRPALTFSGPVESLVPERLRPQLLAVLREALSNVSRHAGAGRVEVSLRAEADQIALAIQDDGVGLRSEESAGGLRNLRVRAERLAGSFTITPVPDGGTRVEWRVPLPGAEPDAATG